ncbi:general secretion pathway protein GspB [Thiohalobacter thiocyanaticus]|nr:general secretion pathway protein GspB [Thiohalobacter thiocyanaticus]
MSYILEALKKSEQERQLGAVPRPELALPAQGRPSRSWWPWLLAAVLLLNAGILVWLMLRPAPSPLLTQDGAGASAASLSAGTSAADSGAPATTAATGTGTEPPAVAATGTESADTQAAPVTQPAPQPPSAPQSESSSRPQPVRGSVQWMRSPETGADTTASEPAAPAAADVPHWEELRAAEKSGLTRPRLDVHVYAEAPAQRFVLIDLRRYREGERLDSGGRLEAITPEGVIIEARGTRYRIGRP